MTTLTNTPEASAAPAQAEGIHHFNLAQEMRQMASDYHVPMGDKEIGQWHESLSGRHTNNDNAIKEFKDYSSQMAQGLYPTLAPQIANGLSTETLLAPYRMVAHSVLGEGHDVNFHMPHFNRALTGNVDEKTGRAAPMGLDQWRQELMNNPAFGYNQTDHAQELHGKVVEEMNAAMHGMAGQ